MKPNRVPGYLLAVFLVFSGIASGQDSSLESRVEELEREVGELRRFHIWPLGADEVLPVPIRPAGLEGNINVGYGYPGGQGTVLVKDFFVILHDNRAKIPKWVAYHISGAELDGNAKRTDDFRADPELPSDQRAELVDYRYSGYDRGHMAPAADFKRSRSAMSGTFVLSNMCPQRPNLNRRVWSELEDEVRSLVRARGDTWVVTGPLFLDEAGRVVEPSQFIGPDSVAVPTHFFKVVFSLDSSGSKQMFAFILRNSLYPISGSPAQYMVSVDSVETVSDLDFFSDLSDEEENHLERIVETMWPIQ